MGWWEHWILTSPFYQNPYLWISNRIVAGTSSSPLGPGRDLDLGLGQTQALGKPGRGQPTVSQEIMDVEKGLKILRLIYSFLHANILTPYSLLPLPLHASKLGALLSRRKLGKDTKVPYPRPGVGTMGRCCIRIVITYQESAAMVFMRCE